MIGAAAAYMSGLFFASFFTEGSDFLLLAGLFPVFFIIAKLVKLPAGDSLLLALFFGAACCAGGFYDHFVYGRITAYDGVTGSFTGTISDVQFYDGDKASYTLEGEINGVRQAKITFYGDASDVSFGDMMTLENCEFRIPEGDYLFDTGSYYRSRNIFLEAVNADIASVEHSDAKQLKRAVIEYRDRIISEFNIKMGETEGSFLAGIVFGETSGMNDSGKTLIYRCGIGHILAVSGLHVSIAAALLMFVLSKLRVNKFVSFGLMNIFIALMIIMVRSPVSVIRAAVMVEFIYSARLFRRQNDTFNSLAAAVLIICAVNPCSVYDRGFMLSVAGTFGLGVFAPYMTGNMKSDTVLHKLLKSFAAMLCVSLTVMPLSILYFDETSVISPITNVLLIPLCIAAMIMGMLYAVTGGIVSLLTPCKALIDVILFITDKLGRLDFTYFSCGSRKLFTISLLGAVLVILTAAITKRRKFIALSLAGAVTVFIFSSSIYGRTERSKFRVAVLGRGSNAAVAVTYKGKTDVIDLSGHYKSAEYVRKYLLSNGISCIDSLALTVNVQSQYASYAEALELSDIENLLVSGDSAPYDPRIVFFGDSGFTMVGNEYSLEYSESVLKISYNGAETWFLPADEELPDSPDMTVFYGNTGKNTPVTDGRCIYLDELENALYPYSGMNNFEIIISAGSGGFTIRRL